MSRSAVNDRAQHFMGVGVDALCFGELILQDHDPARRVEGVTAIGDVLWIVGNRRKQGWTPKMARSAVV
ncbi:hypothetical protein ACFWVM_05700 [Nocardia fluminea]|uniref:hypothetical protein n=1 Tax=Nocardia fluminea TaxID=134984 RepID=UPI00365BBEBC